MSSNLIALFSSCFAARQTTLPASLVPLSDVRRFSELSEIINVSISCQLVFAFLEIFFQSQSASQVTLAQHKMSKHPDGTKSTAEPKLLIFLLQWLGFGFGWPEAQNRDQTLGLRSDFLSSPSILPGPRCEAHYCLFRVSCFPLPCKLDAHLRLPESIND